MKNMIYKNKRYAEFVHFLAKRLSDFMHFPTILLSDFMQNTLTKHKFKLYFY